MEAQRISAPQDLDAAFAIRREVFVIGQNVPAEEEYDTHDAAGATHYLARAADGTPCGAARWRKTDAGVKLERFAVLTEYRNQQAGAALLEQVLKDVDAQYPDTKVYLHAQLPAVRFYERHGFEKEGEMFEECDIQHFKMVRR
ncbi:GNAT family N-acetyltransferase [Hymenobacter sp.]|jgi:predicted GNAT family N-acyltransferase|uniref:GNAT family N-acetyltransferase n=1 Tax=Hymenobacter sp. TaxID=1898978 RepID=UPI002EDB3BD4